MYEKRIEWTEHVSKMDDCRSVEKNVGDDINF